MTVVGSHYNSGILAAEHRGAISIQGRMTAPTPLNIGLFVHFSFSHLAHGRIGEIYK